MPHVSDAAGFENTQLRLASGLTFPEELLIASLRVTSGRSTQVAPRSTQRTLVVLALVDLALVGRMRQAGTGDPDKPHLVEFGDAGTELAEAPLSAFQHELVGSRTVRGWIKHHRAGIEKVTAQSLADRGLITLDSSSRLTGQGQALGAELREGYREILAGDLLAPPAEALWLLAVERARLNPKVLSEPGSRVTMHTGFRQDDPLWSSVSEGSADVLAILRSVSFTPVPDAGLYT